MVKRTSGKLPRTKSMKKKARLAGKLRNRAVPVGVIRDAWNTKLTSEQNLRQIGLTPVVNSITPVVASSRRRNLAAASKKLPDPARDAVLPARLDVREALEEQAALPEKTARKVVKPGEERALAGMVAAHGDNYEAMARYGVLSFSCAPWKFIF